MKVLGIPTVSLAILSWRSYQDRYDTVVESDLRDAVKKLDSTEHYQSYVKVVDFKQ